MAFLAYFTHIMQHTKKKKNPPYGHVSKVKNLILYCAYNALQFKQYILERENEKGDILKGNKKKTYYVASFFVCLSTHFVRATNLMSDNVTLQNTSL